MCRWCPAHRAVGASSSAVGPACALCRLMSCPFRGRGGMICRHAAETVCELSTEYRGAPYWGLDFCLSSQFDNLMHRIRIPRNSTLRMKVFFQTCVILLRRRSTTHTLTAHTKKYASGAVLPPPPLSPLSGPGRSHLPSLLGSHSEWAPSRRAVAGFEKPRGRAGGPAQVCELSATRARARAPPPLAPIRRTAPASSARAAGCGSGGRSGPRESAARLPRLVSPAETSCRRRRRRQRLLWGDVNRCPGAAMWWVDGWVVTGGPTEPWLSFSPGTLGQRPLLLRCLLRFVMLQALLAPGV